MYLAREITFGQDGDFSWERFEARYNADLANNLGNLVSRIATMAAKYRDGRLEVPPSHDESLRRAAEDAVDRYRDAMESLQIQEGAASAFALVNSVNEFLTASAPWVLAKDDANADRLSQVLYDAAEATRVAAVLLLPVIPGSAAEILRRFGSKSPPATMRLGRETAWGGEGALHLEKGPALWPRLEPRE